MGHTVSYHSVPEGQIPGTNAEHCEILVSLASAILMNISQCHNNKPQHNNTENLKKYAAAVVQTTCIYLKMKNAHMQVRTLFGEFSLLGEYLCCESSIGTCTSRWGGKLPHIPQ